MGTLPRTDEELLAASQRGQVDAFERLVERYQSLICGVCFSATGNWAVSEDVAQETFLAAWSGLAGLREPAKLRAWLCGIARNLSHKAVRTRRAEIPLEDVGETVAEGTPLDAALERETEDLVWRALERIPDRYREPLVLFYQQGCSASEVAAALELTEATVHQRLSRGRRYLKAQVSELVERTLSRHRPKKGFAAAIAVAIHAGSGAAEASSLAAPVWAGATAMSWTKTVTATLVAGLLLLFLWRLGAENSPSTASSSGESLVASVAGPATPSRDARSPRFAPRAEAATPASAEPAKADGEEDEPEEKSASRAFFTNFDIRGVEQDWAQGKLGSALKPCLEPLRRPGTKVTFTLDFDGDPLRSVRATGGTALGPEGSDVEACLTKTLRDFGITRRPGEVAELEVTASQNTGPPPFDAEMFESMDLSTLPSRGPAQAPITMTVFTGLRCVYCGTLLGTIDQLMDEYPNVLRVAVKPIALTEDDVLVTEAAYAAQAQGRFWPVHDAMFADQDRLKADILREIARTAGLDLARFDADMKHRTFREQVEAERAESKAMGVVGLPCTILGGERIMGAQPIETFRARIDELLALQRQGTSR